MQCQYCGNIAPDGAKFCTVCGKSLQQEQAAPEPATVVCQFCGSPMKPGAVYCVNCGKAVAVAAPGEEPKPVVKEKKNTGWIVAFCIILSLLLVVGGVLLYIVLSDKPAKEDKQPATPDKPTTETVVPVVEPQPPELSSYLCVKEDATWGQASLMAQAKSGYLVCINDAQEMNKVCQLAEENEIIAFWAGASRSKDMYWEDVRWQDGTKLTRYTPWLKDEPTYFNESGETEELYLLVFKVGENWYFNDASEEAVKLYSDRIGYIVEIEE